MRHYFIVEVECETPQQAEQVMAERLEHDEEYGFDYRLRSSQPMQAVGGKLSGLVHRGELLTFEQRR